MDMNMDLGELKLMIKLTNFVSFQFHASMDEVLKYVDQDLLPVEYGGKSCPEEITDSLKRRLADKRDTLLLLDGMEIEVEPYAHLWRQSDEGDVEFGMEID